MAGDSPLTFGATTSLSATSTTGNAALPTKNSNQIVVTNLGPDLAYIAFGTDNTVTATTGSYPLLPGTQIAVTINPTLLYGAAITASTTATIKFTAADGYISGVGAASTGASGGVTDNVNLAQVAGTATVTAGVSGLLAVGGNIASGVTDAGDPIKIGGVNNTTLPTLTNGQRGDLQVDTRSGLFVVLKSNGGVTSPSYNSLAADGLATSTVGLGTNSFGYLYNGTTEDKARSGGVTGMAGVNLQATPSGGATYTHIAAGQATTVVKGTPGTLYSITFNSNATATNVTTVYDNASGSGLVVAVPAATLLGGQTLTFAGGVGLNMTLGITIITTTANGADMTVGFK